MTAYLSIASVVCANGLGHFRRSTEVLSRLAAIEDRLRITIVCEAWQRARMADHAAVRSLEACGRVTWVPGVMSPGVEWNNDAAAYRDGRLQDWIVRLAATGVLESADFVVTDNLPQVLALRPDAVLMGSFLWSSVLEHAYPRSIEVSSFVERERALLAEHTPPALCVRGFAMPDLIRRTKAVQLPWMCPDTSGAPNRGQTPGRRRIAILAGGVSESYEAFESSLRALLDMPGIELAVPAGARFRFSSRDAVIPFRYTNDEFLSCAAAICRPALGTIHDCIGFGIPMLCMGDGGNAELVHNGNAVQEQGLGIYLGSGQTAAAITDGLSRLLEESTRKRIAHAMMSGQRDGYDAAASWLSAELRTRS